MQKLSQAAVRLLSAEWRARVHRGRDNALFIRQVHKLIMNGIHAGLPNRGGQLSGAHRKRLSIFRPHNRPSTPDARSKVAKVHRCDSWCVKALH